LLVLFAAALLLVIPQRSGGVCFSHSRPAVQFVQAESTPMIAPIALFASAFAAQQPPIANPCDNGYSENVWDPRFTPGQRWSYRARTLDQNSTLTINKVDYVPDLGIVVHIRVDHVDFDDKPGDRPHDNGHGGRQEYFAIRRDSLDASALELLGISQVAGPPRNYSSWQHNCGGLTYGTTVADTLKTLQDEYLTRRATYTKQIVLIPDPSGKAQKLILTFTQRIIEERSRVRELEGRLSFTDGSPAKDTLIEITPSFPLQQTNPLRTKTGAGGQFSGVLPPGLYNFKLTLDGFQSQYGTLGISADSASLSNLHSGSY
jgi:hypothetical protein